MQIRSIDIRKFAALQDLKIELDGGVNIIEGSNESGKSTIAAFIKYMLYGFSDKNERMRASPAGGSMIITDGNRTIRIERETPQEGTERIQYFNVSDGAPMKIKNIGDTLFGVSGDIFARTAFISQENGTAVNSDGNSGRLDSAIENLLYSADETVNTKKALKKLDDIRVSLLHKNGKGGKISELTEQRDDISARLTKTLSNSSTIAQRETMLSDITQKIANNKSKYEALSDKINMYKTGELLMAVNDFHVCERDYQNAASQYKRFSEKFSAQGYDNAAQYLHALEEADLILTQSKNAVNSAQSELQKLETNNPQNDTRQETNISESKYDEISYISDNILRHGGIPAVSTELRTAAAKVRKLNIFSIIFVLLTLSMCAASIVFIGQTPALFWATAAIAAAVCIAAVICISGKFRNMHKLNEMYVSYGLNRDSDIESALTFILKNATELREQNERSHEIGIRRASRFEALSEAYSRANDVYNRARENMHELISIYKLDGIPQTGTPKQIAAQVSEYCEEHKRLFDTVNEKRTIAIERKRTLGELDIVAFEAENQNFDMEKFHAMDIKEIRRRYEFCGGAVQSMTVRAHEIEVELASLRASFENPTELYENLTAINADIAELSEQFDAVVLASEKIAEASENLRTGISPKLAQFAGNLMNIATAGKYPSLGVDSGMNLYFTPDGKTLDSSYMSFGTRDTAYIALRFALINLLYRRSDPPAVFDEAFARIDDIRLKNIFRILYALAENSMQSIIFTCQSRDALIMRDLAPFKLIKLDEIYG